MACRSLAPALLCMLVAAGAPRPAGAATWSPGLDFELLEDRPGSSGPQTDGWITRMSPRLGLARIGPGTTLELGAQRSFDTHPGLAGPEQAGDAATMRFLGLHSRNTTLAANAGYISSRDPLRGDPYSPVTFSESAVATGAGRLEMWRFEGEYGVRSHTYHSSSQSDGLSHDWSAALFPFRRPDTRLQVGGFGRRLEIDREFALTTNAVTLGMRRDHFPGLSSELQVGAASSRERTGAAASWDVALVAGMRAERGALRLPVDMTFRVVRDLATTGFVEASYPGNQVRFTLRAEQVLGSEGGHFSDPTMARYVTFEVRDTLMGAYALSLEGSLGRTRSYFEPDQWLRTYRAWASLSRRIAPWVAAGLDYSYLNQDAAASEPSWVFRRSRVGLRLTMGAQ